MRDFLVVPLTQLLEYGVEERVLKLNLSRNTSPMFFCRSAAETIVTLLNKVSTEGSEPLEICSSGGIVSARSLPLHVPALLGCLSFSTIGYVLIPIRPLSLSNPIFYIITNYW